VPTISLTQSLQPSSSKSSSKSSTTSSVSSKHQSRSKSHKTSDSSSRSVTKENGLKLDKKTKNTLDIKSKMQRFKADNNQLEQILANKMAIYYPGERTSSK